MAERTAPLRSILHAAAQVLSCDSVNLARITEDRTALVLAVAENAWGVAQLEAVETVLGFKVTGLRVSLSWTDSFIVRAFREQRLLVAKEVTEMAGTALPEPVIQAIRDIIGDRIFALVPITGRGGTLGVLIVERLGQGVFTSRERDLLLMYADRVGAALESEALADEASRLEQLGQVIGPPPPMLWSCVVSDGVLCCRGGAADGRPLHAVLGVSDPEQLFRPEVGGRLAAGETVTLSVTAGDTAPTEAGPLIDSRSLRLTLRAPDAASAPGALICAVEELGWGERLRREATLARAHLTKVMHAIGDAILTLDQDGIIEDANDACRAVLGLSPAQLTGRSALDLAANERGRERLSGLAPRLRKSGFAEAQLRLVRHPPGGGPAAREPFPAHLSAMLLCDESLRPVGALWRIHDQTERRRDAAERRRLRLRLLQTERLSALGEMAARIAHEVRNPLVSIGAAAQVVAEELPEDSPVIGEVRAIRSEVRRLDAIITEFLRFARPRRQKNGATDVRTILREVVELIRPKASGLQLKLLLGERDEAASALVDPDGLKQVLWNVLLNACEVSRPGEGPASVVECAVRTRGRPGDKGTRILINIADGGPGIPPALRRRVFDPFFSTKARGTGLGLSICKQIIEEHGGRIRLLNRRGGGTRVVIELRPAALLPDSENESAST